MTTGSEARGADIERLEAVQQRILWLAVRMVDHANRERPPGEIKVGGHQASSASMIGIMTALWFAHLSGDDKVAVKPHASPVYHAIKYLTGELDRSYLTTLRALGGLQAYPSRTKDPDVADFSTGSVGLGVVAPLFAAATRRYIDAHFQRPDARPARFIALAGDAELDEGNVWEAITDPTLQGLGNVMWVIDTNRQSLDRVVPEQKIKKLMEFFEGAGWHVVEAKYGRRLTEAFERPGGDALRRHIDDMSNEEYQSLFAHQGADLRKRFLDGADGAVRRLFDDYHDDDLAPLVQNLGGHDLGVLIDGYRACDGETERPSVVFAYTVKGWGLPIAGDPLNHSAMLSGEQIDDLRASLGLTPDTEWDRFDADSPEGRICRSTGGELNNVDVPPRPALPIPDAVGVPTTKPASTQETFGRILTRLGEVDGVRERIVTTSPDVSVSTNLGGWINKMGVFAPQDQPDFLGEGRLLRWKQTPSGQHIELGLSEMNLFLLLQALGLGHDLHGEHLLPIGTVYDPFVCRGLDALIYGLYSGARFVIVGTPAGITLAPEGGAHQSTITPSIGLELPELTFVEPAYARALDWLLCDGLGRLADADGTSLYVRLSTRPVDQAPFVAAGERLGADPLRADVLAGGYRLAEPDEPAGVVLVTCGPVVQEVLAAAEHLAAEGLPALVLDLTSPDRLYRAWRQELRTSARRSTLSGGDHHLARLLQPSERALPIVTVHDAASHHLAWLGGVFGARTVPVGVDEFGQSGSIPELYELFDLLPDQIVNAALVATSD
ncbi:MAG: pyruvate dehydrogenase [Actinomycetota bacterium]|nr:pyruvate dehydrogenase [Actinomycetota bacterium]